MSTCNAQCCSRQWDENPIMSETEPSSDPPIQNPSLLDSPARWRQLGCPHIVLSSRGVNSSCYLQKESLKILLKIMGPSSLYWWYKARRSQNFYLNTVIYCCKNVHRFVAEKLLLLTVICSVKATAWLHLSLDSEHAVTSSMVFPSCIVWLILSTECWRPSVHNRGISIVTYTLHFPQYERGFSALYPPHNLPLHHPYTNFLDTNCWGQQEGQGFRALETSLNDISSIKEAKQVKKALILPATAAKLLSTIQTTTFSTPNKT